MRGIHLLLIFFPSWNYCPQGTAQSRPLRQINCQFTSHPLSTKNWRVGFSKRKEHLSLNPKSKRAKLGQAKTTMIFRDLDWSSISSFPSHWVCCYCLHSIIFPNPTINGSTVSFLLLLQLTVLVATTVTTTSDNNKQQTAMLPPPPWTVLWWTPQIGTRPRMNLLHYNGSLTCSQNSILLTPISMIITLHALMIKAPRRSILLLLPSCHLG